MTRKLTTIQGNDGQKIYIEYEEEEADELQALGFVEDIQERTEKFQKMMVSTVSSYCSIVLNSVRQNMTDIANPTKVTMEFGVQAGGEAGVPFITKGTAEANVKITVEWDLNRNI